MTDTKAVESKSVTLYNGSQRTLVTSKGIIPPGKSVTVPHKEADLLCVYQGVMDASKISGQADLDIEIEALHKQLSDAQQIIKELEGKLSAANTTPAVSAGTDKAEPKKGLWPKKKV